MNSTIAGAKIQIRGIVQGVGFRPFIYSLALRHHLLGWVRNTSRGVEIEVDGQRADLEAFVEDIHFDPPPLARIDSIDIQPCLSQGFAAFEILSSQPQPGDFVPISPDVAICQDCRREIFDPTNRRYRYPFTNCTNCGPRFTIIQDIPYDRPNTTMSGFKMCPECQAEYDNPLDRRFHAQPTACPVCGPQIHLEVGGKIVAVREDSLQLARQWLADGKILAIKGLGGYHLACSALNAQAVAELRRRKKRSEKAFALMAFDCQHIIPFCQLSPADRALIESPAHPIVLLPRRKGSSVPESVAPGQTSLGFMLPYTPLHLLLTEPGEGFPDVLVMTSGNLSEEPIAYDDADARQRLAPLADAFLVHDRPIHMRVDDSVMRQVNARPYPIRRSRGYAPDPIVLSQQVPPILAAGAELKNAFCLTRDRYAFISHFIGDLENYETLDSFESGIRHFENLFRIKPERIACDQHPDYLATRYAHERAQREQLPLIQVQHHHAHLAACLADNRWETSDPVIGLCFDGTGLGSDGAVWGGEVLLGGYTGYQRWYHLNYVPMPGGDIATRKPSRMALAYLNAAGLDWDASFPCCQALCAEERFALKNQVNLHINSPLTSSLGRLFDAVAAFTGICENASYEGQAAILLEAAVDPDERSAYPFEFKDHLIETRTLWSELVKDFYDNLPPQRMAAKFHNGLIRLVEDVCQSIRRQSGVATVALSGGVWQNMVLLTHSIRKLSELNFTVLTHSRVPANDGGICLGQALIAAKTETAQPQGDLPIPLPPSRWEGGKIKRFGD